MANSTLHIITNFYTQALPSSNTEPTIQNSGAFILQPRSISIISVQGATELNTWHLYQLNAADDLPSGNIPLAVDHKIGHKYPKLLKITLLHTKHNTLHIWRKNI